MVKKQSHVILRGEKQILLRELNELHTGRGEKSCDIQDKQYRLTLASNILFVLIIP